MRWPEHTAKNLLVCGCLSLLVYAAIFWVSFGFSHEVGNLGPIFPTLCLFAIAFVFYVVGMVASVRFGKEQPKNCFRTVVGFAVLFRAVMLFSEPIKEVDIYRYLWDGLVCLEGISPFEYPPVSVMESDARAEQSKNLHQLTELRDRSPGIHETLSRVHFPYLPTVYPPTSQLVFAATAVVTPDSASVTTRVRVMKFVLLLFDMATVFLIARMLALAKRSVGWVTAYAWCPLVLKEFANSGHLDAIAVCLSALAVLLAAMAFFAEKNTARNNRWLLLGAGVLGLAVGAKLYPIALVPILAITCWRRAGQGTTVLTAVVFFGVTLLCLLPLRQPHISSEPTDRRAGFKAFLSRWMMNDFIFLNLAENVTPDSLRPIDQPKPWFLVTSDSFRETFVSTVVEKTEVEPDRVPFVFARAMTAGAFTLLSLLFAWKAAETRDPCRWFELVFLTMAWFWLLLPTLNPWYWIWALPWIGFAKNRAWFAMSGLLFIYYARFYFESLDPTRGLLGTEFGGAWFFDYVLVWFEYVPWFTYLLIEWWRTKRSDISIESSRVESG